MLITYTSTLVTKKYVIIIGHMSSRKAQGLSQREGRSMGDGGCRKNAPVTGVSQEDPAVARKHGTNNQLGGLVVAEETVELSCEAQRRG